MTRIYEEAEIDVPRMGTGKEIYNFLISKSATGRELVDSIRNRDLPKMCLLSARLGKIGYTDDEIAIFLDYIFYEKNI
jgi:hypothetical protein